MKTICYLADASNPHVKKWCKFFLEKGYEIHVISLNGGEIPGVKVHNFQSNVNELRNKKIYKKFGYLLHRRSILKLVNSIKPDIFHAQYASSYGFLGSLVGYHPFVVSVWGTDIYDFPRNGAIQKWIIKHNFKKADYIFSNSVDMGRESNLYTDKKVHITYFGVDMERFKPMEEFKDDAYFTFGIVKSLEKKYGIKYLIDAYDKLYEKYNGVFNGKKMRLLIGGGGQEMEILKSRANDCIAPETISFLGRVSPEDVAKTYNMCDVCVFPSLREGFGVSAIESQACQVPVIITEVGGHPESVDPEKTGIIVKSESVDSLYIAMEKLMTDDYLRMKMGKDGREFVKNNYKFEDNFEDISKIYGDILEKYPIKK
ncbi:glycosyltransferase [Peptostreptococcus faecalis]|uniref:glycosyltransferase n=1 Tax=Peptostreptococcus faecalis TaxID=2045015 RepID=UPI000C79BCC9|nr:glycosyltransferase [Peptostreptococcus faecalis]